VLARRWGIPGGRKMLVPGPIGRCPRRSRRCPRRPGCRWPPRRCGGGGRGDGLDGADELRRGAASDGRIDQDPEGPAGAGLERLLVLLPDPERGLVIVRGPSRILRGGDLAFRSGPGRRGQHGDHDQIVRPVVLQAVLDPGGHEERGPRRELDGGRADLRRPQPGHHVHDVLAGPVVEVGGSGPAGTGTPSGRGASRRARSGSSPGPSRSTRAGTPRAVPPRARSNRWDASRHTTGRARAEPAPARADVGDALARVRRSRR